MHISEMSILYSQAAPRSTNIRIHIDAMLFQVSLVFKKF